jgi:hypothetical protein
MCVSSNFSSVLSIKDMSVMVLRDFAQDRGFPGLGINTTLMCLQLIGIYPKAKLALRNIKSFPASSSKPCSYYLHFYIFLFCAFPVQCWTVLRNAVVWYSLEHGRTCNPTLQCRHLNYILVPWIFFTANKAPNSVFFQGPVYVVLLWQLWLVGLWKWFIFQMWEAGTSFCFIYYVPNGSSKAGLVILNHKRVGQEADNSTA